MSIRAVFERSRREVSLDVSVGVHMFLVVEQSSLESQSRGCAKTPILDGICLFESRHARYDCTDKVDSLVQPWLCPI